MNTHPPTAQPGPSVRLRQASAASLILFATGMAILWAALLVGADSRSLPVYTAGTLAALGMFGGATTRMIWPAATPKPLPSSAPPATTPEPAAPLPQQAATAASALTLATGIALFCAALLYQADIRDNLVADRSLTHRTRHGGHHGHQIVMEPRGDTTTRHPANDRCRPPCHNLRHLHPLDLGAAPRQGSPAYRSSSARP